MIWLNGVQLASATLTPGYLATLVRQCLDHRICAGSMAAIQEALNFPGSYLMYYV